MSQALVFRSPLARLPFVLVPLGLFSLALGAFFALAGTPDAWAGLAVGLLFLGTGGLFGLTRRALVVEPRRGRWAYSPGLLQGGRRGVLADLSAVRLSVDPAGDLIEEGRARHRVELVGRDGARLPALESDDPAAARAQAVGLARRLRLPLETGRTAQPPEALDEEVAAALRTLDPADASIAGLRAAVGGRGWGLLAGAALLVAALTAMHILALGRGGRAFVGFGLVALPFDAAALWAGARGLAAVFGREALRLTPGALEVERRVGPVRAGRWAVPLETVQAVRLDEARQAVRVEAQGRVLELGRRLDPAGRRRLAAELPERLARAALGRAT